MSTHTEIAVSPEDDIELRRLRITNRTREPRTVDVVTYAEVVLAPVSDELHPAYSKLFVQTELVPASKPSCAPAEPDRSTRRRLGCSISSPCTTPISTTSPMRPTAAASSDAATL